MPSSELSQLSELHSLNLEPSLREGFMLGDIIVLPNKGLVVRQHQHHHLSPKAMELLVLLSSNAGKVLSRQDLSAYLWADQSAASHHLSSLLTEVRHALDDHKECPVYIQTLARKGLRLLMLPMPMDNALLSGEVLKIAELLHEDDSAARVRHSHRSLDYWRHSRLFKIAGTYIVMAWVLMQVIAVTLPIVGASGWLDKLVLLILIACFPLVLLYNWWLEFKLRRHFVRRQQNQSAERQITKRAYKDLSFILVLGLCSLVLSLLIATQLFESAQQQNQLQARQNIQARLYQNAVAVMPFKVIGGQDSPEMSNQLQSEVLRFLSQSSQLRVISERVLSALPDNASLAMIRQLSGAKYILEGAVSMQDKQMHITTTLTDSESGYQLWANKTTMPQSDQLALLETISHQVFNALTFLMPQDETAKLQFRPTNNIHAYDYYVRAKATLQDAYNEAQLKQAEQLFLQALAQDQHFELAQAGLCRTYIEQYRLVNVSQIFELARQACQSAIDGNSVRAESAIALGNLYYASGQYVEAQKHFAQALSVQANNSLALTGQAQVLARLNQADAAAAFFLQAIQEEPGYWRNYEEYGRFLFAQGKYFEASLQFEKQSILQPTSEEAFNNLGAAYYLDSQFDKASQSWRRALAIQPSANIYSNLATSLFFTRQFEQAIAMYQQAVALNSGSYVFKGNLADAYKLSGKPAKAADYYQLALTQARDSQSVNPHDLVISASIGRYQAELGDCQAANKNSALLVAAQPDDPYIYYDLALIAGQCSQTQTVLSYLAKTLELGYSAKLLRNDPQFSQYQAQLSRLTSTN